MNTKALAVGLMGLLFLGGRRSSGTRKIPVGSRLLLVGDSQSVGDLSPGGQLAQQLQAAGYKVRGLAVGGKTAAYFAGGDGQPALLRELAQRPAAVLVFLGTNEAAAMATAPGLGGAGSGKGQSQAHKRLRDLITKAGARPLFIGPPNFRPNVKGENGVRPLVDTFPVLVPRLESVYTETNFLDARPLTPDHKGIHFDATGAASFALALTPAVLAKLNP